MAEFYPCQGSLCKNLGDLLESDVVPFKEVGFYYRSISEQCDEQSQCRAVEIVEKLRIVLRSEINEQTGDQNAA